MPQQPQQQPQPQDQEVELPYIDLVSQKSPEYVALHNRLAANDLAMDAVNNWRDTVANVLFSHEQGGEMMNTYQGMKQQPDGGFEYVSGALFGVLAKASLEPEKTRMVMDALLSGRSLGEENERLIQDGFNDYKPFVKYILEAILKAYKAFEERTVYIVVEPKSKADGGAAQEKRTRITHKHLCFWFVVS